ncbi:hypothetical protein H6G33_37625 [Calothrix sp. FACHB-1219]|uniref:hypothetical protein n=1 Tax=unclassified Calothrix TaxID=2619626 RepID=UPI0016870449|nr:MULTISPECIES: hypothetical protein [unclassified Calothrix]MBD2208102.1 hypothetical protein [Calothrix sp. FACHB-168]MBD2222649.1 hypothetical protein [Calothrix sp. FACHB-1219]
MKRWITAALLILLICPAPAVAQTNVKIEVDAKDKPLEIKGWLGEENSLISNIRLTASGGDVTAWTFLPSDLKRKEGDEVVGRQQVELIGERKLEAGLPKDFQVKLNGVKLPGTYEGQIEILLPSQKRSEALVIPLTVKAKARPALTPVKDSEQVQLQLVRCSWDCGLAHLLLPSSAFQSQRQIYLDNSNQATISLTSVEVILHGKQTNYQITNAEVEAPPSPQTLAANKIISLPLKWKRSQIPPDRYTGAVYLTMEGKEGRLSIPIDLSMRTGPAMPIFVLFLGIILGRLFKYMQEKGIPQSDALAEVYKVENTINQADQKDQEILNPMVTKVRSSVKQMDLETANADLIKIKERKNCLDSLRKIEQQLAGMEQDPDVGGENGILAKINEARKLIQFEKDDQAQELLEQIESSLVKLSQVMMGANQQPDPSLTAAATEAVEAQLSAERATKVQQIPVAKFAWLRRLLIVTAGVSNELRAEATLWVVRPLLSLTLLIGLSLVGIRALYVEKGLTFGANPFADYLELILWGLSADVASRSLSSLPGRENERN